jgi:2-(1,2-epoxy-1,2-dihydrophenyl)acetyl-CoA isomerase
LWFLARMVGMSRAWEIVVSGRAVDATEARELGLFHRVAPAEEFPDLWRATAREFAEGPTLAYRLTKKLLVGALERDLDDQLEAEIEAQGEAGLSQDHREGVRAFLEKRPPRFTGR